MNKNIHGLTDFEVQNSRALHGQNELPPPETESFWDKLKDNFDDPLIKILCGALGVTILLAFLGFADWIEGFGIALAVLLATFVATFSEYKNEQSFQKLQQEASLVKCNVYRNGTLTEVLISDVVVGDSVKLGSGFMVPADGLLISGSVSVSQKTLSGEARLIHKTETDRKYIADDPQEWNNPHLLFRGSLIDEGDGVMLIQQVGVHTIYGRLASDLATQEDRESPLQVKLSNLADAISRLGYMGASGIAASFLFKQFIIDQNWALSQSWTYLTETPLVALKDAVTALILAIIIIVVAVPEGLPMMIAIVLSLNMRKLLANQVLVRKLLGIETAGSLSLLFVDKTGTLTKGEFSPHVFMSGNMTSQGTCRKYDHFDEIPTPLADILLFTIQESTIAQFNTRGQILGGNSSDRAILSFIDKHTNRNRPEVSIVNNIIFNSTRKFAATQIQLPATPIPNLDNKGKCLVLVKGAPDILLPQCTSYYREDGSTAPLNAQKIESEICKISKLGDRVILIATSTNPLPHHALHGPAPPTDLTMVGILGISDVIRPNSKSACAACIKGGIQIVMITGDKKETAVTVARDVGLLTDRDLDKIAYDDRADDFIASAYEDDWTNIVLTSNDLRKMSDQQIAATLPRLRVVARALPTDKSRLVKVAQGMHHVVGMTGDGVNDSAALKKADVGFAMGSGADMAKEASDIVILDDNFSSIAQSVLYGRTIFRSIRKFIVFQSTVNLASTIIVFIGPFLGFDFPLSLVQLLWVNLVMDTLAALAYGGEPALPQYMDHRPIQREAGIISVEMWSSIISSGLFIALMSIFWLTNDAIAAFFVRDGVPDQAAFLTGFFCYFIFATNFNSFNVRTKGTNLLANLFDNKNFLIVVGLIFFIQITFTYVGGNVLKTVGLTFHEWLAVIGLAFLIIPFDLLRKTFILPRVRSFLRTRKGKLMQIKDNFV